ncbi:MAG: hypothetical protein AB1414_00025 [bacterium]
MKWRLIISFIIAIFILPISVSAQQVVLRKWVNTPSAKPGDILNYNITYQNLAPYTLNEVSIIDVIPINTIFQEARGTNTTIYYCHDNSNNFGTSSSLPITKIKWVMGSAVEVGGVGTVTLQLKIR